MSAISTEISDLTDAKLIEAVAQSRSEPAFAELVDRHASWVYAAASRQLGDAHLAEDATQAVFVLLFQRASKMNSHQKISGWLFMAVHYTVRSMQRAMRRRRHYERKVAQELHMKQFPNMEHSSRSETEIAPELDREVARLPQRYRDAIVLRFYQGMQYPQLAAGLGITESAARKRVTRGVERLRNRLGATEAGIGTAAMIGTPASMIALKAQLVHAVSGAAVVPHVAVAAKGAASLMTMAKVKITAAIILTATVVAGSTGVAVKLAHDASLRQTPGPAVVLADAAPASPAKTPFDEVYGLDESEILRHIPPPFVPQRMEFYRKENPSQAQAMPKGDGMIVHWRDGKPHLWSMTYGPGYTIQDLLEYFQHQHGQNLEGDPALLSTVVPGDFSVREGWDQDQMRGALEQMLAEALRQDIRLTFREVDRPVVVLSGSWKGIKKVDATQQDSTVEIYGKQLNTHRELAGGGFGSLQDFGDGLGEWIGQSVVFEVKDAPNQIAWRLNDLGGESPESRAHAHDKDLVLRHLQEQTGLTWKEETRKVNRLFVERHETKPGGSSPFDEVYGLQEGEILRRIPPPFVPQRMEFYRKENPMQAQAMPKGADGIIIHWRDGKPQLWGMTYGDGGYSVGQLLEYFQNQYPQDLGGDKALIKTVVPGDFSVREGWNSEEMRGALEMTLGEALNKDIRLNFKEVERPVTVLSGPWHGIKTVHPDQRPDEIEIYGRDLNKNHLYGGGGSGSIAESSKWLGSWINEPIIVDDVTGAQAVISYHFNDMGDGTPDSRAHARDKDLVLKHFQDQTGLTWKEEKRKIQALFVETGGKS